MRAAETFLNGGTNYDTPLRESIRLMQEVDFEKADIVFISDGECALSESFQEELLNFQVQQHFTITGVLLDKGTPWI